MAEPGEFSVSRYKWRTCGMCRASKQGTNLWAAVVVTIVHVNCIYINSSTWHSWKIPCAYLEPANRVIQAFGLHLPVIQHSVKPALAKDLAHLDLMISWIATLCWFSFKWCSSGIWKLAPVHGRMIRPTSHFIFCTSQVNVSGATLVTCMLLVLSLCVCLDRLSRQ